MNYEDLNENNAVFNSVTRDYALNYQVAFTDPELYIEVALFII